MRVRARDWRIVVCGLGMAAGLAAFPAMASTRPSASTRPTASTRANASHGAASHAVALSGGHKGTGGTAAAISHGDAPSKRSALSVHGVRLAVRDGVYYHSASKVAFSKNGKVRYAMHRSGMRFASGYGGEGSLQCVPFARAASGIELKGNAANWWDAAAGVYERGSRPEPGSVLNFRSTGHMRLGHVAVVAAVINGREIEIDHANWAGAGAYKGGVARGVHVVDVSPENDWSEVRVARNGGGEDFGNTYPTYGFIYDRPDDGTMIANSGLGARSVGFRNIREVAEAPRR